MNIRTACFMIGNGNIRRGHELVVSLALRCKHARAKHPVFAEGLPQAVGVVSEECRELNQAVEREGVDRTMDEAWDVAATAVRLTNREWE